MNIAARPDAGAAAVSAPDVSQTASPHVVPDARVFGAFTVGPIIRHVLVMTATSAVGLVAVFFVDFLTLLYISRLGNDNLTAAVGYASQVTFLIISVNIGLTIAVSALVSRSLGAGDRPRARRIAASGIVMSTLISGVLSLSAMPFTRDILWLFGARGETLAAGAVYLRMALPAMVFLGVGMASAAILRGVGDARRAMYVTLGGAAVTVCLDPIFIFVLHLGIYGAGIVLILSRLSLLVVGLYGTIRVHDLVARPRLTSVWRDAAPLARIAVPAVLTNLATPIANIYVLHVFSRFGEPVVAAYAIMDRVSPVAFGVLFALSGAVGPIMGQNYGARAFDRVQQTLTQCLILAGAYVVTVTVVLWLAAPLVVAAFDAKGETAALVSFFCHSTGVLWFFLGGLFVANAAFNNLDWPVMSACFNWGRATLGTIPFVALGTAYAGPKGGYLGLVGGSSIFGCLAIAAAYFVVGRVASRQAPVPSVRRR